MFPGAWKIDKLVLRYWRAQVMFYLALDEVDLQCYKVKDGAGLLALTAS